MAEFVTVGSAGDVRDGEVRPFEVGGRYVAVARVDGSWYAFDDTCTHRQCSLSEGELDGMRIECPCHGSVFDVATGAVLNPPAPQPIETFAVRVEGDDLQVGV